MQIMLKYMKKKGEYTDLDGIINSTYEFYKNLSYDVLEIDQWRSLVFYIYKAFHVIFMKVQIKLQKSLNSKI